MNPARRRRLLWVLLFAAAAAIAVGLLVLALQRNLSYLYTPSEVLDGQAGAAVASGRARFRLGGMVEKGSFQRAAGSLQSRFAVTDGDAHLPVSYDRILPDLFGEGQAVVASGRMQAGSFVAEQVLAKHDETYMPREVADKMQSAHRRHAVPAAADTATGAGIAVARAR